MGINIPYKIVSFKENICTGYIEKLDNYSFTPHFKQIVFNLATSLMKTWTLVVETISPACRVAILPSSTPWILKVVSPTAGKFMHRMCGREQYPIQFVRRIYQITFQLSGCLAYHQNDPDFSGSSGEFSLGRNGSCGPDYEILLS